MSPLDAMARAACCNGGKCLCPNACGKRMGEVNVRSALAEARKQGWKLVPVEPTLDMVGAAREEADCYGDIYRAMISASPSIDEV